VELFADIRRDARVEECSIRELAERYHVHRRTVRQALASAVPPPRKTPERSSPKLAPFAAAVDGMLRADLDAPKKQRHTARRVLARLVDEHGAQDVSYSTVRDYVAKRRPQIAAEAGKPLETGCVPQTHPPAAEAEVDFHDLWVILAGVKTKTALFTMRLSYSGRAVHRASLSQGQEAFLEAHVHAFDRLGGVPLEQIRYDNLKPAVSRVLFGRCRVESDRWVAFRSHSLLTELSASSSQFTGQIRGELTTVTARVRRRDDRAGSGGPGGAAGGRAGGDRQQVGAVPAA